MDSSLTRYFASSVRERGRHVSMITFTERENQSIKSGEHTQTWTANPIGQVCTHDSAHPPAGILEEQQQLLESQR